MNSELKKSQGNRFSIKRQFGTERKFFCLPHLHEKPTTLKIALSRIAIILTIVFWLMYFFSVIFRQLYENNQSYQFSMEAMGYLIVVTFLSFSALMYLLARQGALQRFLTHIRVPRAVLDTHFDKHKPTMTVLVPSYAEETQVIRKTLMSAVLQEYPDMKIVLLLDDNPNTTDKASIERINKTRALKDEISNLLKKPHKKFEKAFLSYQKSSIRKKSATNKQVLDLANNYSWAADWLSKQADEEIIDDHIDVFFTDQVLHELEHDFRLVAKALNRANEVGAKLATHRLEQLYRRLLWIFGTKVEIFERKKYISLSHEPNKAMNLNSYIGLMGKSYKKEMTPDGVVLTPTKKKADIDLDIPDSDFVLTLDADSILLKDYCLRLVYFLQQPGNEDVAVTQTPYSSFRGATTRIERLSSATTDIQHILHQGMSHYNATFWVGANAVIRKKALHDIQQSEWVGGYEIKRFVQDNTVIEDTESSIDMAIHGWRLVNYPERLSYSATPPDFGSLVVQRRRWANGGLLILPKIIKQMQVYAQQNKHLSLAEILLRVNYMASIAWSNFGLVFLLAYPYDGRLLSPLVLLTATPYFLAMASDLKYSKYKYIDVLSIYGFNLILLPVNIVGILKSIQQALTSKKIPFARTPKVKNRTAVGLPYLISPILIIGFSIFTLYRNILGENWGNAAFAGFNAFWASWAVVSYIGIKNLIVDLWLGVTDMLYVDEIVTVGTIKKPKADDLNWQAILYHGDQESAIPHSQMNKLVAQEELDYSQTR